MKVQKKILGMVILFILSVAMMSFGVFAAITASLTTNGTVNFNAYGVDIDIEGNIIGAAGSNYPKYFGTTNQTRSPDKNLISESPWNFGVLNFNEDQAMSLNDLIITIEFKIINYSKFAIETNITVPTITGLNITKQEIDYAYAFDSVSSKASVTLQPKSIDIPVHLSNLNISINILKTIKSPPVPTTPLSAFVFSSPINNTVKITKFTSKDKTIVFPSHDALGNKVIEVNNANSYNSEIKRIVIPEGVTKLGQFNSFIELESIVIPSTISIIPNACFYGCISIKEFVVHGNIKEIGDEAFAVCEMLKSINGISNSVEKIGEKSFCWTQLENVKIYRNAPFISLGDYCFASVKSLDNFYFVNNTVKNQFLNGKHFNVILKPPPIIT